MRSTAASKTRSVRSSSLLMMVVLSHLTLVASDDFAQLGDVALHVVVGLGHQRAALGALEDFDEIDHLVLPCQGRDRGQDTSLVDRVTAS
jgi:hypothetical protein